MPFCPFRTSRKDSREIGNYFTPEIDLRVIKYRMSKNGNIYDNFLNSTKSDISKQEGETYSRCSSTTKSKLGSME